MSAKHTGNACQPPITTGIPQAPAWVLLHRQITSMLSRSKLRSLAGLAERSRCTAVSAAKVHILARSGS